MSLTFESLGMRFGGNMLFKEVNIQLHPGKRYGLVGANGAGKSTLLKILTNEIEADAGQIRAPKDLKIGWLKQDQFAYDQVPILDVVIMGNARLWEALQEKERILAQEIVGEADAEQLAHIEAVLDHEDGYSAVGRAARLLQGLGMPSDRQEGVMKTLSGGYRVRVLLAQLFFSAPDVLLLDEPTNHLDIFSIMWLGDYLRQWRGMLIVSSHHRDFLNTVSTDMLDLDYGTLTAYKGNYDAFEVQKADDLAHKEAALAGQERKRDDLQGFVDRFGAKASKAKQAQSRVRMIQKLEQEMADVGLEASARRRPNLAFIPKRQSGAIALRVEDLWKAYGDVDVLHGVNFELERGEKVAIIGANGIGKSTLLEIVTGNITADKGENEWGFAARVSYFPQDPRREANGKINLVDWLQGQVPGVKPQAVRSMLGRCLFSGDDALKQVDALSGGEVARLVLGRLMLQEPNVLVFDEPTNHLDMEAIEALVESLQAYEGTLLLVSHNTYFLSRIATRVMELTREGVRDYRMTFNEYTKQRDLDAGEDVTVQLTRLEAAPIAESSGSGKEAHAARKKQRNRLKQLERELAKLEKRSEALGVKVAELDKRLASAEFYNELPASEQQKVHAQRDAAQKDLDRVHKDWEKAAEELESAK